MLYGDRQEKKGCRGLSPANPLNLNLCILQEIQSTKSRSKFYIYPCSKTNGT